MNWTYFRENGPNSKRYSHQGKERERYKNWFIDHQTIFDSTKIYDFFANDNKELVEKFKHDFIESYNSDASRIFAIKIHE